MGNSYLIKVMSLIKYLNTRPLIAHFILNPNSVLSSVVCEYFW